MGYFDSLLKSVFGASINRYKRQFEAEIQQKTIGRAQSRMTKAQHSVDDAVYSAQGKVMGSNKKTKVGKKAKKKIRK